MTPTESDSNIMRAFEAGWGGVVTKTIGLHPVVNVDGPKTKFLRATPTRQLSMQKRPGTALHSSWNWELISDKPLDWWIPRIARIKKAHPDRDSGRLDHGRLGQRPELQHWQTLAKACQDEGADAFELNLSCPHMDRKDMGSNIGKDQEQISIVTQVVKEVARVPVWAKLTPSTTDIVEEARGAFLGGADAIVVVEHVPVDAADRSRDARIRDERRRLRLERRARRAGDPAAVAGEDGADDAGVPRRAFSGIGGIATFAHALNYFLLGCGTVQVCTAAMLDHAIGPNIIKGLIDGMQEFMDRNKRLDDARGLPRHPPRSRRRALADPPARRRSITAVMRPKATPAMAGHD